MNNKISRVELAGWLFGKAIISVVNLMYHTVDIARFYHSLSHVLLLEMKRQQRLVLQFKNKLEESK